MWHEWPRPWCFCFQSRIRPRVHEAGGRDGRHLGGRRRLVGGWWPSIHLVLHRHDKRVPGSANLRGGWLPAPGPRRVEEDLQQEPEDERRKAGKRAEHYQSRDAQHGRQRHSESEHEDRPAGDHLLSDSFRPVAAFTSASEMAAPSFSRRARNSVDRKRRLLETPCEGEVWIPRNTLNRRGSWLSGRTLYTKRSARETSHW